jgi:hypothetical protein
MLCGDMSICSILIAPACKAPLKTKEKTRTLRGVRQQFASYESQYGIC